MPVWLLTLLSPVGRWILSLGLKRVFGELVEKYIEGKKKKEREAASLKALENLKKEMKEAKDDEAAQEAAYDKFNKR